MSCDPDRPLRRVTVEMALTEPALTQAAFELLYARARLARLRDVHDLRVSLKVTFEGFIHDTELAHFQIGAWGILSGREVDAKTVLGEYDVS